MRHSILVASILALVLATPAYAQGPDIRPQVENFVTKMKEAVNKGDGKSLAALFTSNGSIIDAYGKHSGPQQISELVERVHQLGITLLPKVDEVQSLSAGQAVLATGPYSATYTNNPATPEVHGNLLLVLEREGDSLKARVYSATRLTEKK